MTNVEQLLSRVRAIVLKKELISPQIVVIGQSVVIKCETGSRKDLFEDLMIRNHMIVKDTDDLTVKVIGMTHSESENLIRGNALKL